MNSIDAASRYQAEGINADAAQSIVSGVLPERSKGKLRTCSLCGRPYLTQYHRKGRGRRR